MDLWIFASAQFRGHPHFICQLIHKGADVRVVSAVDAQPVSGAEEVEFQFEMGTQNLGSPGYAAVGLFAGPLLSPKVVKTDPGGLAVLEPLFYERDPFSPAGRLVSGMLSRKAIERVLVRAEGYKAFDSGDRFHYGPDADGEWVTRAENREFWELFPKLVVELSPEVNKPSSKPNL